MAGLNNNNNNINNPIAPDPMISELEADLFDFLESVDYPDYIGDTHNENFVSEIAVISRRYPELILIQIITCF